MQLWGMKQLGTLTIGSCLLAISLLAGCGGAAKNSDTVEIEIKTVEGTVVAELYPKQAPESVKAFLAIVDRGLYKRSYFYRILSDENQPSNAPKAELIQGGLWSRTKKRPELPRIPHETTQQTGLTHSAGTISLAREEPGSASSEFFITLSDLTGDDPFNDEQFFSILRCYGRHAFQHNNCQADQDQNKQGKIETPAGFCFCFKNDFEQFGFPTHDACLSALNIDNHNRRIKILIGFRFAINFPDNIHTADYSTEGCISLSVSIVFSSEIKTG